MHKTLILFLFLVAKNYPSRYTCQIRATPPEKITRIPATDFRDLQSERFLICWLLLLFSRYKARVSKQSARTEYSPRTKSRGGRNKRRDSRRRTGGGQSPACRATSCLGSSALPLSLQPTPGHGSSLCHIHRSLSLLFSPHYPICTPDPISSDSQTSQSSSQERPALSAGHCPPSPGVSSGTRPPAVLLEVLPPSPAGGLGKGPVASLE